MEYRKLPKVDRLLDEPRLSGAKAALGARGLKVVVREVLSEQRAQIRSGGLAAAADEIVEQIQTRSQRRLAQRLEVVVNATGVLLHTNLGRAPLAAASVRRIAEVASGYSNLELDTATGERTRRAVHAEFQLAQLSGAESALIVNNNAAAVLLALSHLAAHREVIVSRGELVEIGGGFRIPDVLARSGAKLVEVGTTNRTRIEDFENAITENTACLLRVHPSNFHMTGFVERPVLTQLGELAERRGIPLIKDLGGGVLSDAQLAGIAEADRAREPTVEACLRAGCDAVCFSLDKLFGGPQGGAIVGSTELIAAFRKDPFARAVRVGKLTLAALEPILDAHVRNAFDDIPVLAMTRLTVDDLKTRGEALRERLASAGIAAQLMSTEAAIGGGTLAEARFPSIGLNIGGDAETVAQALRNGRPAILGRIVDDRCVLDLRTLIVPEGFDLAQHLIQTLAPVAAPA